MYCGGMYVDIWLFTHGKAHVSIEFVPYLYRKATMLYTGIRNAYFDDVSKLGSSGNIDTSEPTGPIWQSI